MPANDPKKFKTLYEVDNRTKCWNWIPKAFRFRVNSVIQSPRRYSVQVAGYQVPLGRYLVPACGNERCVNPDHMRLKQDGTRLDPHGKLYLPIEYFDFPPQWLADQYCTTKDEIKAARKRTLELIKYCQSYDLPPSHISKKFGNVAESFIKHARTITVSEFEALKNDPNAHLYEMEHGYNPRGERYKLD